MFADVVVLAIKLIPFPFELNLVAIDSRERPGIFADFLLFVDLLLREGRRQELLAASPFAEAVVD